MIRILFVDNQRGALENLQGRLLPLRMRWQTHFARSGGDALALMLRQPIDIVIADMQLPDMDGAHLLSEVQRKYPDVLRFAWSGETGRYGTLQALPVAHQVLIKSCDINILQGTVERSHALQQRLMAPAVRRALGMLTSIPALPSCYSALSAALDDPGSNATHIAGILEKDVSMSARILQLANSAFFPGVRKVTHVKDAVTKLGMLSLRGVVLTLDLFRSTAAKDLPRGFSLEELQQHSIQVGQSAAAMLSDQEETQAFSAGMLHEIGTLLLATGLPLEWAAARNRATLEHRPLHEIESEILGCSHAEIGGRILTLWGLPNTIVEAVTYQHRPTASGQKHFGVVAAIHVANVLAHAKGQAPSTQGDAPVDEGFLVRVGGLKALEPGFHAARRAAA